ncbi:hypothetical protein [Devosia sp.]
MTASISPEIVMPGHGSSTSCLIQVFLMSILAAGAVPVVGVIVRLVNPAT